MSDVDLVRDLFPERELDTSARGRVRASVAARTYERRGWARRRFYVPAVGLAAASAVATAVVLVTGTSATPNADAARLLRQAATAALQHRSLATLGPDQFLYTKSTWASTDTYGYTDTSKDFTAFVPSTREVWLRRDGTGWLYQTSGAPTFLSERDRQAWIAAGRPSIGERVMDMELRNSDGPTAPMASLDLPTDPDVLYAQLEHDAAHFGDRKYAEMFTIIGDDLRENYTTPAQRAALFEVAARLPGIVLVPGTKDGAGRAADGVAIDDSSNHDRLTLLFDPVSRALLGEEDAVLSGNSFGYPDGTVISRATYLTQSVVDSVPQSVVDAAKH